MECFTGLDDVFVVFPEFDDVSSLSVPTVRTFTTYCRSVKPHRDFARPEPFRRSKLQRWIDYFMIVDYVDEIDELRYRHYGTGIAKFAGFDMTGRLVSDFDSEVGRFFERLYRKCLAEKIIIYSEHNRVHARRSCNWHRVLCPVQEGNRTFIVACNVPVPKADEKAEALEKRRAFSC
jgi:hypothetical protein